ncbi:MAG: DNA polymerase III subunit epsilon, partial [Pseudomonadota bacterium]
LLGGRARSFEFETRSGPKTGTRMAAKQRPNALPPRLTSTEREAHAAHIDVLGDAPIWRKLGL